VEGGTLKEWIDTTKPYAGGPPEAQLRILDIAIQMAWGLQNAHGKGVVHQDVKPANVLMLRDARAKITDFGHARARATARDTAKHGTAKRSNQFWWHDTRLLLNRTGRETGSIL